MGACGLEEEEESFLGERPEGGNSEVLTPVLRWRGSEAGCAEPKCEESRSLPRPSVLGL